MSEIYDLIVIGAGPGGYESALEAAKLGLKTAVIEKDAVGGTCLNRGCIPTKTLMHSSDLCAQIRGASRFGIGAGEPSVDMEAVQRHKDETVAALQKGILSLFKTRKVTLYQGVGTVMPSVHSCTAPGASADSAGISADAGVTGPSKTPVQCGAASAVENPDLGICPSSAPSAEGVSCEAGLHPVRVTAADGSQTLLEGRRILLATGSIPSRPPIPGLDLPGVMTSDELLSYKGAPFGSLLIIGGGVIGIEFAGIYQNFGTKIIVVEALPSLLANMDKELGQSLKLSLKKKGADIHTSASVQRLEQNPDGTIATVFLEKEKEISITADAVLVAVGRRAYTGGAFAEGAAPAMNRGRVVVDASYQTSIPGIYAIGDVNGQIQLAHAATAQGKHAVQTIAAQLRELPASGRTDSPVAREAERKACAASAAAAAAPAEAEAAPAPFAEAEPLLIPACVYTDPEIASVGMTLEEAKAAGLAAKSHKIVSSANGKSVLSLQERGFIKVIYLENTHVIIGAQLLCARATDMVSEFAVAIRQHMTMEQMADIVRPHPTFSEMITDAAVL